MFYVIQTSSLTDFEVLSCSHLPPAYRYLRAPAPALLLHVRFAVTRCRVAFHSRAAAKHHILAFCAFTRGERGQH